MAGGIEDGGAVIAIAGAGSIGCYVGGCLALAGRRVQFLARASVADEIQSHGIGLSDFDGFKANIGSDRVSASYDPVRALSGASHILVTVKSRDTEEMAHLIQRHAPAHAIIISLQNGVRNAELLARHLPGHRVLAGMVPFNVVQRADPAGAYGVHRATSGTILIAAGGGNAKSLLDVPHARLSEHRDMRAIQWGKLILNLNNALNALSGLPLARQLSMRAWRKLLADQMQEALGCLRAARITAIGTGGVPLRLAPRILRLPNAIFLLIARQMLAIDPSARSSMWEDLERRRVTEIDYLQGEILKLAEAHGREVPVTRSIVAAVKAAERAGAGSPGLSPEAVRSGGKAA